MSERLHVTIQYLFDTDKFVIIKTNIKESKIKDIVHEWLLSRISAGEDNAPANEQDMYTIELQVDLADDSFYCTHDCGNKGLREGILMRFCEQWKPTGVEA